ncbi:hypothetical protein J6590_055177 [Homalodisca vitripennis]|nr:hypothetical protein J6590_055177 [Homalodisca vitripennis]
MNKAGTGYRTPLDNILFTLNARGRRKHKPHKCGEKRQTLIHINDKLDLTCLIAEFSGNIDVFPVKRRVFPHVLRDTNHTLSKPSAAFTVQQHVRLGPLTAFTQVGAFFLWN